MNLSKEEYKTDKTEYLLDKLLVKFEESFSLLPNYLIAVKVPEIKVLIEAIYKSIPPALKESENIINTNKLIEIEAQKKAEQIIQEAKNEAARILSESNDIKKIQIIAEKRKEEVLTEAQEIRRKAIEDVQNYKIQVQNDATSTKQNVEYFAEQILKSLDTTLTQHLQFVKEGQTYIKEMHNDLD